MITKEQIAEKANIVARLEDAAKKVEEAIDAFNTGLEALRETAAPAIEAYNDALREAAEFTGQIASDADFEFGEKSEKWQESERGQDARDWIDTWNDVDLEEIAIEWPEEIEQPDLSAGERIDQLPDKPGE